MDANAKTANQDVKERAKELYLKMPIARHTTIAQRLGIDVEDVRRWAREGLWLNARAAYSEKQAEVLRKADEEHAEKTLKLTDQILALIEVRIARMEQGYVQAKGSELRALVDALHRIWTLRRQIMGDGTARSRK